MRQPRGKGSLPNPAFKPSLKVFCKPLYWNLHIGFYAVFKALRRLVADIFAGSQILPKANFQHDRVLEN